MASSAWRFFNLQLSETQQELTTANKELQQLRNTTKDQKKEVTRMQTSLESEKHETARLQADLQKAKKAQDEAAKSKDNEKVGQCDIIIICTCIASVHDIANDLSCP